MCQNFILNLPTNKLLIFQLLKISFPFVELHIVEIMPMIIGSGFIDRAKGIDRNHKLVSFITEYRNCCALNRPGNMNP